jgi:hypothetical protein
MRQNSCSLLSSVGKLSAGAHAECQCTSLWQTIIERDTVGSRRAPPHRGHRGRLHRRHLPGQHPLDRPVATDWTRYGAPADPVLQATTR